MVILFLRLGVRRELIIRRDGRAVEGTGLENRRCESIRGFESHSLRQLKNSPSTCGSTQEAEGAPAKGVGRKKRRGGSNPLPRQEKQKRKHCVFSCFFFFISSCFAKKSSILVFQKMPLPLSLPQLDFLPLKTVEKKLHRPTDQWSFLLCTLFSFS